MPANTTTGERSITLTEAEFDLVCMSLLDSQWVYQDQAAEMIEKAEERPGTEYAATRITSADRYKERAHVLKEVRARLIRG